VNAARQSWFVIELCCNSFVNAYSHTGLLVPLSRVRQWHFSSPDATRETEEYKVDLSNVTLLDLIIDPDKENGKARGSVLSLRLA